MRTLVIGVSKMTGKYVSVPAYAKSQPTPIPHFIGTQCGSIESIMGSSRIWLHNRFFIFRSNRENMGTKLYWPPRGKWCDCTCSECPRYIFFSMGWESCLTWRERDRTCRWVRTASFRPESGSYSFMTLNILLCSCPIFTGYYINGQLSPHLRMSRTALPSNLVPIWRNRCPKSPFNILPDILTFISICHPYADECNTRWC